MQTGLLRSVSRLQAAAAAADYMQVMLLLEGGLHFVSPRRDSHDLPAPAHGSEHCQACFQLEQFGNKISLFPPPAVQNALHGDCIADPLFLSPGPSSFG